MTESFSARVSIRHSSGLQVPLSGFSLAFKTTLDRMFERALLAEVEGDLPKGKRAAAQAFAQSMQSAEIPLAERPWAASELATFRAVAWTAYMDMLTRAFGPVPPEHRLSRALLDRIDWLYPSRYAAHKDIERKANKVDLDLHLPESTISKIEHKGRGCSTEKLSRLFYLLGMGNPMFREDRAVIQASAGTGEREREPDGLTGTMLQALTGSSLLPLASQPFAVLVPPVAAPSAGKGKAQEDLRRLLQSHRLRPIQPSCGNVEAEPEAWENIIAAAREGMALVNQCRVDHIEVQERRGISMRILAYEKLGETPLLASLLDLGHPLLQNLNCILVRQADVHGCALPFRDPFAIEDGLLRSDLLDVFRRLEAAGLGVADLFLVHAEAAKWLGWYGPPADVALGGIQSVYLLFYLAERVLGAWAMVKAI